MTQMPKSPAWSLSDARATRAAAESRLGRMHRWMKPIAAYTVPLWSRIVAALRGPRIYKQRMERVAQQMNRNRNAFTHYTPTDGDVVVSAYFKAGTNWIMHTCHQICHLGEAEFDHIQDVIPWPDAAEPRFWVHVDDPAPRETPTGLRTIKSHLAAYHMPITANAKYIAVTRDPKDCAASAYHFFRSLVFGTSMPPPDNWLDFFASEDPNFGRWDAFTASWYALRDHPNVLFLTFEEVKADTPAAIRRIVDFMGVTLTPEQFEKVAHATSLPEMKKINHKFYPARQTAMTDPKGRMIRKGVTGDAGGLFSEAVRTKFDNNMQQGLVALNCDFPYQKLYRTGETLK